MAVVSTPQAGKITLVVSDVVNGKTVEYNRSFSGVKSTAADQDAFDAVTALAGLQTMTVAGINRTNVADLANA